MCSDLGSGSRCCAFYSATGFIFTVSGRTGPVGGYAEEGDDSVDCHKVESRLSHLHMTLMRHDSMAIYVMIQSPID